MFYKEVAFMRHFGEDLQGGELDGAVGGGGAVQFKLHMVDSRLGEGQLSHIGAVQLVRDLDLSAGGT